MTSSAILPYPIIPITSDMSADMPVYHQLADALLDSVAEHHERLQGRRIWLACSGGRDSLVLAALCLQLYQQGKLPFLPQLLHVNHNLQADSHYWAEHVAHWARVQKMPCHILTAHVEGHDEQAARQARYQVMRAHINQEDVLLLAHHADDQAETVLMRLIQGAGVNGLSGMQSWRVQSQGGHRTALWRPWLSVRRATISNYAKQLKLPYIDDPTNDDGDNVRSGLRLKVLPALTVYNANAIANIARSAQLLADAQAIVSDQAKQDLQQTAIVAPATDLSYPPAQRVLDIDELHTLPLYRQRQLLHAWLAQDEPLPPTKQLIDDVLRLTQRDNHNHQTQLCWQARTQQYRISRYRQQLYRLSSTWLEWLQLPIAEQTQILSDLSFDADRLAKKNASQDKPVIMTLRVGKGYRWQLEIAFDMLMPLISHEDKVVLKAAPLDRQQRVQTTLATRPQAGKKLYQTLGVPVWLRDSLVVISAVSVHTAEALPLLLISPFESWVLGVDKSVVGSEVENEGNVLKSALKNVLIVNELVE